MRKVTMTNTEHLYDIVRLIRPAHRRLSRAVEAYLSGTGISVGMRAVMEVLEEAGPMSVPGIGRILFLSRQQIQLSINALEELGLVARQSNPAHKRSPLFVLTEDGQTRFGEIRMQENDSMDQVSGLFTEQELDAAQRVLTAMLDRFAEFDDDPDKPKGLV